MRECLEFRVSIDMEGEGGHIEHCDRNAAIKISNIIIAADNHNCIPELRNKTLYLWKRDHSRVMTQFSSIII